MVKWLTRLASNPQKSGLAKITQSGNKKAVSKYGRTPVPPKPYNDRVDGNIAIREDAHNEILTNADPERPHWRDPKFESRRSVPVFDLFGFNRNYSVRFWKVGGAIMFVLLCAQEVRIMLDSGEDGLRLTGGHRSAIPGFARDDMATERELREAGFSYVGTRQIDNVGTEKTRQDAHRV